MARVGTRKEDGSCQVCSGPVNRIVGGMGGCIGKPSDWSIAGDSQISSRSLMA